MKRFIRFNQLFIFLFILQSCENRIDFCECISLEKAITDPLLLSEQERKKKEEGCKWIQEELSEMEILQKWAECYNNQTNTDKRLNIENSNGKSEMNEHFIFFPATPEGNYDETNVKFIYYPNENGNRPYAEFHFSDGTNFYLTSTCNGDYFWCVKNNDNIEIAYLKIEQNSERNIAYIDIKYNEFSENYNYYLSKMTGTFYLKNE